MITDVSEFLSNEQIVVRWVKNVAWQHRLPQNQIDATNATILPYGSYGLGVRFLFHLSSFSKSLYILF